MLIIWDFFNFAKLHCIRYNCESEELLKNTNMGITKFEMLLMPQGDVSTDIQVYPQDALTTSTCKLSSQFRQKSLKSMIDDWIQWEEKTIELLLKLEHESYEDKCDMEKFYSHQIKEVQEELLIAKKLNLKLMAIDYTLTDSENMVEKLLCTYHGGSE